MYGHLDCLELLVAKGAKLDATDNYVSAAPPAAPPSSPPSLALRLQTPPARPPPPLTRVCAAAPASRQYKGTALRKAACNGHAPCVEALLKAGADARLKNKVRDGAEGRGGRRKGAWGARGGGGAWGEGPCAGTAPPLRAAHSPRPHPPRRPPPPPPLPSLPRWQDGDTALDDAKSQGHTQVIALLENAAAITAQVGPST